MIIFLSLFEISFQIQFNSDSKNKNGYSNKILFHQLFIFEITISKLILNSMALLNIGDIKLCRRISIEFQVLFSTELFCL